MTCHIGNIRAWLLALRTQSVAHNGFPPALFVAWAWIADGNSQALWAIVSVGLLTMFLLLRSHQPLRFRSQGSITSHWAALSVIVVAGGLRLRKDSCCATF